MNIVVLDAYTLNPGDLSWAPIEQLGPLTLYERTPPDLIVERASSADILLVNKVVLNKSHFEQLPRLRYIGVMATGYNNIEIATAREQGITVTNIRAYSTASVAQHTFTLLLGLMSRPELHDASVKAGDWAATPDFCYWKTPLTELHGKTMGLIGLGDIGTQVARIAQAFGMRVLAYRRNREAPLPEGVQWAKMEEVFRQSDVLSLHCPLTPETNQLINQTTLSWMKPSAILLNTGRGALIQEADLAEALRQGTITGAALDVLSVEPPTAGNPLIALPNCLITPHVAWASFEARQRLMQLLGSTLNAYLSGQPINVVN